MRVASALVAEDHCTKPSSLPLSGVHPFVPASAKLLRDCGGRLGGGVKRLCLAFLGAVACAALASCAVGPDYHPPDAPMPANFVPASSISASSDHRSDRAVETAKWWRTLHDRELDSLIDRAIAASPSLEIALDRLQQARAQEAVIVGAALPAAEASIGGACRRRAASGRLGYGKRSGSRPRLANACFGRERSGPDTGHESHWLRRGVGDRRFW